MQPFPQKLPSLWFTQNIRYFVYFLREFTGILIAIWVINLILAFFVMNIEGGRNVFSNFRLEDKLFYTLRYTNYIGFFAAIFHSLTWLYVMTKLSPIPLKGISQKLAYAVLIIIWLSLSYITYEYII